MKTNQISDYNRRDFLKGGSLATLATMMGGVQLTRPQTAQAVDAASLHGPEVKLGVIGLGPWGRDILNALALIPEANIAFVCDTYPATLKKGANVAPKATPVDDYKKILDDKEVKAVIIATASHQHKDVALAAMQAGKHVYCEAPLAHTIEDARAIARLAKNSLKLVFQAGLQTRSDPQRHFLLPFVRSGASGKTVMARAQWHKKHQWRQTSPNAEREKALNWRLDATISPGLLGEIGIHQVDGASWFINRLPIAVSGSGTVRVWTEDGRDVADTVTALFEYPEGVPLVYDCTLGNSFDSAYEILFGTDAAIMMRENKAWMFKEADSPLLGWEVYARKDTFYKETGIALSADATKQAAQGRKAVEEVTQQESPLRYALSAFLTNVNSVSADIEEFAASYNINDKAALEKYLSEMKRQPAAGYKEGFEATVVALKANEAIVKKQRIELPKALFDLS